MHASVGNKSLGKTVTSFALAGSLKAPTVVSIDIKRAFAGDGEKICLLKTEVLLRASTVKLAKYKKLQDWTSRNAVLLMPFLIEIVIADGKTAAEALLKIFYKRINEKEAKNASEDSDME